MKLQDGHDIQLQGLDQNIIRFLIFDNLISGLKMNLIHIIENTKIRC